MDVGTVPKEVLKRLALEYQDTHDGAVLKRILLRVDRLIMWIISNMVRRWKHLSREDRQDLYQTALVGLCDGLERIQEQDSPDQAVFKLVAYIRSRLRSDFPVNRNKFYLQGERETRDPIYRQFESECLREVFQTLIQEGVVTKDEYHLLQMRYVLELPWRRIASLLNLNITSAKQMAYAARDRMRHQLRIRGITGED